jgi:hypothetical protein
MTLKTLFIDSPPLLHLGILEKTRNSSSMFLLSLLQYHFKPPLA